MSNGAKDFLEVDSLTASYLLSQQNNLILVRKNKNHVNYCFEETEKVKMDLNNLIGDKNVNNIFACIKFVNSLYKKAKKCGKDNYTMTVRAGGDKN